MSALTRFARDVVGQHVDLNGPRSGDRDAAANDAVIGATTSPHLTNQGADIQVAGMSNLQVADAAANSGLFTGVGYYEGGKKWGPHAHVDIKGRGRALTTWTVDKNDNARPGLPPLPCEDESCKEE